jgi:hypothetical protein
MAKKKKTNEEIVESVVNKLSVPEEPTIETFMPCEWVIQFDNDEPQLFTTADETVGSPEVVIKIQNTSEGYIKFTDPTTGKTFKFFARPKK